MIHYLTGIEILRLNFQVVREYGGSLGVRDENRLSSVVGAPKQDAFGHEQYPSIYEKAAVYFHNIIGDHPFVDGNKRTAVAATGIFLLRNGYRLSCSAKELEDIAVQIAIEHLSIADIAKWLEQNTRATN